MRFRWTKLLALPGLLAFARSAFAQGCVLCYTSAASQRPRAIHALNLGIVILLIPPVLIFLGVFAFFYWRRNAWRGSAR
jgi:ABC-type sulfate transport system permease subunit